MQTKTLFRRDGCAIIVPIVPTGRMKVNKKNMRLKKAPSSPFMCRPFSLADCVDLVDSKKNCSLPDNDFTCDNKRECIPMADVCNGKMDCSDRSDEPQVCQRVCTTKKCEQVGGPQSQLRLFSSDSEINQVSRGALNYHRTCRKLVSVRAAMS